MSISPSANTITSNSTGMRKPASYQIGNFAVGRKIGSGSFSVVKHATHIRTQQTVAFKILDQKKIDELEMTLERIWREIDNLRQCASHPHILHIYDVYDGPQMGNDMAIITEYAHGGTLYEHLHKQTSLCLPVGEVRYFFQQIVSGLEYMHHHGIAHRDLTLDNILMDSDQTSIRIADLGFSQRVPEKDGGRMTTACGSPNYAAPELLNGVSYNGLAVDIWSLGVVLYVMLIGYMPFNEKKQEDLFQKIRAGIYCLPKSLGRDAKKLIPSMLEVNATTRVTILGVRKSTFYRKQMQKCLNYSPETISTNWLCQSEKYNVDPGVVDQLLGCYGKLDIPQATDMSSDENESLRVVPVTRDIVERVLANRDCCDEEPLSDIARDIQFTYNFMLHKKYDTAHCKLLKKMPPKKSLWFQFGLLCVICLFFTATMIPIFSFAK